LTCPGSINFTKDYPRDTGNNGFADLGTFAHSIREQCLEFGFDAYDFIGHKGTINGVTYECDDEMAGHLQPGIDEIRSFEGQLFIEKRIDLGRWMPGQFGTLDAGVAGKRLIFISDLKYGEGVPVQAVDNTQQMIYALGFWDQIARHITDATKFLIAIDQPRHSEGGGYWPVTLDQLLAFGEELAVKAKLTEDPDAPLIPSDKGCLWCPAANMPGRHGGCPAHHQWMADNIDLRFEDLDELESLGVDWQPPKLTNLTPERRAHIVRAKSQIEKWLEKLHADELATRIAHGPSNGLKAVAGRRPPQKWRDDATAEAYLAQRVDDPEKIFTRKLISPSQGEKMLGFKKDNHFPSALVDRGTPKPVLVPEADKRSPLQSVDDKFDDEDDDLLKL
jgi:hypothetical protein